MSPSAASPLRTDRWLLAVAAVIFIATRIWLVEFFEPTFPDAAVYFEYALNSVDIGLTPYREVPEGGTLEYPPLAYWAMALPRLLDHHRIKPAELDPTHTFEMLVEYHRAFQIEMLVCDVVSFVLLVLIVRRRRPDAVGLAALGYVLTTTALAHVLHTRLDIGMLMGMLAWAWLWLRRAEGARAAWLWQLAAYAVLGAGVSYKLLPGLFLPFALVADVRALRSRQAAVSLTVALLGFAVTAGGPFLYHYLEAGSAVFRLFAYHAQRPIEVESIPASLLMIARWGGLNVTCENTYGSWNVFTPDSNVAAAVQTISTLLVAAILLVLGVIACLPRRPFRSDDAYRFGCAALLVGMTLGKVLSIQYLLWGLPLMILLGVELLPRRQLVGLIMLAVLAGLLSTAVFPYLFFLGVPEGREFVANPYPLCPSLHPLPCTLLIARNAILAGCVGWLGWKLRAKG